MAAIVHTCALVSVGELEAVLSVRRQREGFTSRDAMRVIQNGKLVLSAVYTFK